MIFSTLSSIINTLKPSLPIVMIKNASLSIPSVSAILVASIVVATTIISEFSSIDVIKSAYAFPCKGGTGEEYCSGYHAGAVQAYKDDKAGHVVNLYPCIQSDEYCSGYQNGYTDEAGFLG
jgi:hypothetical protein